MEVEKGKGMTDAELETLGYFSKGEKDTAGKLIDWAPVSYATMKAMNVLRAQLGQSIQIIRATHPNRQDAVDAVSSAPLSQVAMELARVQEISYGVYSGGSFHVDTRDYAKMGKRLPNRWMAVRPSQRWILEESRLLDIITNETSEWIYLQWSNEKSLDALLMVCTLAEDVRKAKSDG